MFWLTRQAAGLSGNIISEEIEQYQNQQTGYLRLRTVIRPILQNVESGFFRFLESLENCTTSCVRKVRALRRNIQPSTLIFINALELFGQSLCLAQTTEAFMRLNIWPNPLCAYNVLTFKKNLKIIKTKQSVGML